MKTYKQKLIFITFLYTLITLLFTISSYANGVPPYLNYQGTLNNDQGDPFSGNATMVFRIYDALDAAPSDALWDSGQVEVLVNNGRFSLTLGYPPQEPITPDQFVGSERYLGVSVDGTELIPRKRLLSVPYALNSAQVAQGAIPKGVIVMWSGNASNIPDGWTLCDGSNGSPNLQNRFIVSAGDSYSSGTTGGNNSINLKHSHKINDHTHSVPNHTHGAGTYSVSGITGGDPGDIDVRRGDGDPVGSKHSHTHSFSANVAGSSASDGGANTGVPSNKGMDDRLSSNQDIRPLYYALCFIMKL